MQDDKWDLSSASEDDHEVTHATSQEESVDQWAVRIALIVLCVALFIAAVWLMKLPSFEKCSTLDDPSQRHACYDNLRAELLRPPVK
jgi:hypothetical protein